MNERIHEMILEFAEIAEEYSYGEYAKKQTGYSRQYFYNQKFAELIVRECVATITKLGNAYKGSEETEYEFGDFHYMQGMLDSADVIKEHFGVKDERTN